MPQVAKLDVIEQLLNNDGLLLAGGKVYTYAAGTTTPLATYTDSTGGTPNANPTILDSSGRADFWFAIGLAYKVVVQTSAGVVLKTVDGIKAPASVTTAPIILTWTGPQTVAAAWLGGETWRGPGVWTSAFSSAGGTKPKTLPTASYTVTIKKLVSGVSTTVGTAVCNTSGVWTITGTGGNNFSLSIDDEVDLYGSGDTTIADFSLTLLGTVSE